MGEGEGEAGRRESVGEEQERRRRRQQKERQRLKHRRIQPEYGLVVGVSEVEQPALRHTLAHAAAEPSVPFVCGAVLAQSKRQALRSSLSHA